MIRSATLLLSCLVPLTACQVSGGGGSVSPLPPGNPPNLGGTPTAGNCPAGMEMVRRSGAGGDYVSACVPLGLAAPAEGCGSAGVARFDDRDMCVVLASSCNAGFFPVTRASTGGIVGCVAPSPLL